MKKALIGLIIISMSIIFLEFYLYCYIPDSLLMPLVGMNAIIVTLILAYISYSQWQKNRLENEVLKEQLKLIIKYFEHLQKNPNLGFEIVEIDKKVLMKELMVFSPINYSALENSVNHEKYLVQQLENHSYNWFNELENEIIYNPLFPKRLFEIINKLNTFNYFTSSEKNYGKAWFSDEHIPTEKAFVIENKGFKKEHLGQKPLRIPYLDDYLRVSDIIKIYKEFNVELKQWFENNHIDIKLNINT